MICPQRSLTVSLLSVSDQPPKRLTRSLHHVTALLLHHHPVNPASLIIRIILNTPQLHPIDFASLLSIVKTSIPTSNVSPLPPVFLNTRVRPSSRHRAPMGVLAELGRLAIADWSPVGNGGGYIAAGTYAGAIDTTSSSLDLVSVDIARSKLIPVASLPSPDRFCAVHWGPPARAHPAGLIAAGLADGSVRVWDAASLIRAPKGADDRHGLIAPTADLSKHDGPVRAVAFNPFLQTRLASGGADGQVLIWDLSNPSAGVPVRPPVAPAAPSPTTSKDEVTAMAWNRKIQTILGTTTASGVMNVWDLKQNRQVINIRNQRGRLRASSLAWHPEIATQIVITCDEDESTAAVLWDLRNATTPVRSFTHHSPKGVVSASWSSHDPDLLLTSSRDNRTVAVSVSTGDIVAESAQAADWDFDVKWSPRIPGLYLSSSFDGRLSVSSILTATSSPAVTSETANALAESFGESASGFQTGMAMQSPRSAEAQSVKYSTSRPPKWLKRPSSVSFGFGGSWSSHSAKDGPKITVDTISEDIPGLSDSCTKLDTMLLDLTSDDPTPAYNWCSEASGAADSAKDKMGWDALACLFQTDSRRKLLDYLGFTLPPKDAVDDIATPVYGLLLSQPIAVPVRPTAPSSLPLPENKIDGGGVDSIANGTGAMNLDGPAPWDVDDVNKKESILDGDDATHGEELLGSKDGLRTKDLAKLNGKDLSSKSREELDVLVRRSVIIGDFKTAVEACLQTGRTADALVIAHAGGPDLWFNTQAEYLSKASTSTGANVVGAVAGPKEKMDEYIRDSAKVGNDSWKEALAVLLTYSSTEELSEACTALGQRLLEKKEEGPALFCFICGGNTRMTTSTWLRQAAPSGKSVTSLLSDRVESLINIVLRVRLLTAASLLAQGEREIGTVRAMDEVSGAALCEFGALLAAQGDHTLAITYLSNLNPSYSCAYGSVEDLLGKATESLALADSAVSAPMSSYPDSSNTYGNSFNPYGSSQSYSSTRNMSPANPAAPPSRTNNAYGMPPPTPPTNSWNSAPTQPAAPPPAPMSFPNAGMGSNPYANPGVPANANPISSALPPRPGMPAPPRPGGVGSQGLVPSRSTRDPSSVYAEAPSYNANAALPPPTGAPTPSMPAPPPVGGTSMQAAAPVGNMAMPPPAPTIPAPPPVGEATAPTNGLYQPPPQGMMMGGGGYDGGMMGAAGLGGGSPVPPPPPPPTNEDAPLPMSYHSKARPGQGSRLPPSAEVAVAKGRAISASGTPGGRPRRSASMSSSLSGMENEIVTVDKADVSKVAGAEQVIVKSLRGSFMYAQGLNQSPMYKRKMDDVSKRLGRLLFALNAGMVDKDVSDLLVAIAKAIENGNYDEAKSVVGTLSRQHWESNRQWIQGLKWLIDCVVTGR